MPAKLLYEARANWRYATGTSVADAALFYQSPSGKTHVVVNELEWGHLKDTATVDHVHSFGEVQKALNGEKLTLPAIIGWLMALEPKTVGQPIEVPMDFPAGLFTKLKNAGLPLEVSADDPFFPARSIKTAAEIKALAQAQKANEAGFIVAEAILRASKIGKNNTLTWQGATLTAEILRAHMKAAQALAGCTRFADQPFEDAPVVSCGTQSASPHGSGHGPLKANQFIIIDSFPQHLNGYFADCTRTYLKGKGTEWHHNVYNAVLVAQEMAIKLIKPGVDGHHVHTAVENFFEKAGFATGTDSKGRPFGFFHGTGHAVGLELHDVGPRTLSRGTSILKPGMVTSVEPGLYYPGKGGVRIEDTGVVTEKGFKNFATLSKENWLIR